MGPGFITHLEPGCRDVVLGSYVCHDDECRSVLLPYGCGLTVLLPYGCGLASSVATVRFRVDSSFATVRLRVGSVATIRLRHCEQSCYRTVAG